MKAVKTYIIKTKGYKEAMNNKENAQFAYENIRNEMIANGVYNKKLTLKNSKGKLINQFTLNCDFYRRQKAGFKTKRTE